MPIYEFHCKKCDTEYEELVRKVENEKFLVTNDDGVYVQVSCPKCKSKSNRRLNSCPAEAVFTNPEGTRKYINDSTGHDYRFKSKQPKIRAERELMQQVSHMGAEPYSAIDDISSGNNFNPSNWEKDANENKSIAL